MNNVLTLQITNSVNSSRYFIGLSDRLTEGNFTWESGNLLTSDVAAYWKPGQPNGDHKENCVGVKNGEMLDIGCNQALRFVCQKRLSSESSNGNR